MGYLHPPPGDTPVIVMKDFGGDVREYAAMTTAYIKSGREVRLHECRSACTLALAVPNVCVYPDSVLRFHKAYNPLTRATNDDVSTAMMSAYPPAVRERLGLLTRQYKSLTGSELIRLGVRDCDTPAQPKVMIARASARPSASDNPFSNTFGNLMGGFGSPQIPVYGGYGAPGTVKHVKVQVAEAAPPAEAPGADAPAAQAAVAVPTPPPRPEEFAQKSAPTAPAQDARTEAAPQVPPPQQGTPMEPPRRPPVTVSNWGAQIDGSAPVLATARFAPFPYRLIRRS